MGNPLINELIIGTGSKDYWSMSQPEDDSQFASFDLDPLLARVINAVYGIRFPLRRARICCRWSLMRLRLPRPERPPVQ